VAVVQPLFEKMAELIRSDEVGKGIEKTIKKEMNLK
jgi:hypothetical protein